MVVSVSSIRVGNPRSMEGWKVFMFLKITSMFIVSKFAYKKSLKTVKTMMIKEHAVL